MRLADIGIAKKLAAGYLIILVVIAVVSAVSLVNLHRMDQAAELNARSYEAISNSKDILYGLINMETGIRGFIITGRDDFLTPFGEGKTLFEGRLEEMRTRAAANHEQLDRLARLAATKDDWLKTDATPLIEGRALVTKGEKTLTELVIAVASVKVV